MPVKVLRFDDAQSVEKFVGMHTQENRLRILAFTAMIPQPPDAGKEIFYLIVDLEPPREPSDCQLISVSGSSILRSGK